MPAPPDLTGENSGKIEGRLSFLTASVERAFSVTEDSEDSRVIIITGKNHISAVIDSCMVFPKALLKRIVIIPEPEARNTAPAIACCLLYLDWANRGLDRKILVLTSDHIISPIEIFKKDASAAAAFAQLDRLIVFGIPPVSANTGYGYIETSDLLTVQRGRSADEQNNYEPLVFQTAGFKEKPDSQKAGEFLEAGNFYWNSGMFAFSHKFMLNEYKEKARSLIEPFLIELKDPSERSYRIQRGIRILDQWVNLETAYSRTEKISFDYAIAEKCGQTVMVRAAFDWIDVGSWDTYADLITAKNPDDPCEAETPVTVNSEIFNTGSKNTFVDSDIPVALVDADDLIIVIRSGKNSGPRAALVAKKGETQKVQEIVRQIKESGNTGLL